VSWDLLIAVHDRPTADALGAAASDLCTVHGPNHVEAEDLPESLAAAVLAPRFLIELSTPAAATTAARKRALKQACALAERFRGAVYDPQEDAVVWPRRAAKRWAAPAAEERIRVVDLDWYLPGRPDAELAARLLGLLRAACPEALPRRYGDHEPLQHRLEDGDRGFVDFWRAQAEIAHGAMFFWKGQAPCFDGSVSFCDARTESPNEYPIGIPGTRRCTRISLDFDGRALHAEPRWSEAVVALFERVARATGAVYAAGTVVRNVICRRALGYDDRSEKLPLPISWFAGLPPIPTWLAWFGAPYAPLVADALRGHAEPAADGTYLYRGGPEPMDVDQLAGRFPALPAQLCSVERPDAPPFEPRFVPAELIPLP
jgi:hypothetical protein